MLCAGPLLCALHILFDSSAQHTYEVGAIIIPILQRRKLRLGAGKGLAQDYVASERLVQTQ